MTRRRRLVLLAFAGPVLGAALPAGTAAASCLPVEPIGRVAAADAAVVGTLVEQRGDRGEQLVVRVEERIKGDLPGDVVVVRDVNARSSAGVSARPGERIGLLLRRAADGAYEVSCGQAAPEALRRGRDLAPPQPFPTACATALAGAGGRLVLAVTGRSDGACDRPVGVRAYASDGGAWRPLPRLAGTTSPVDPLRVTAGARGAVCLGAALGTDEASLRCLPAGGDRWRTPTATGGRGRLAGLEEGPAGLRVLLAEERSRRRTVFTVLAGRGGTLRPLGPRLGVRAPAVAALGTGSGPVRLVVQQRRRRQVLRLAGGRWRTDGPALRVANGQQLDGPVQVGPVTLLGVNAFDGRVQRFTVRRRSGGGWRSAGGFERRGNGSAVGRVLLAGGTPFAVAVDAFTVLSPSADGGADLTAFAGPLAAPTFRPAPLLSLDGGRRGRDDPEVVPDVARGAGVTLALVPRGGRASLALLPG